MARPLRVQYPNAVYHVTCRGNEQKPIFRDEGARSIFLKKLVESMDIYTIKLYSYVLMGNHFHLLLEIPLGNVSEFREETMGSGCNMRQRGEQQGEDRSGEAIEDRVSGSLLSCDLSWERKKDDISKQPVSVWGQIFILD